MNIFKTFTKKRVITAFAIALVLFIITLSIVIPPESLVRPKPGAPSLPIPSATAQPSTHAPFPDIPKDQQDSIPTPNPSLTPHTRYWEGAIIGKTTQSEIEKIPALIKQETLKDGSISYFFPSISTIRPDEIRVKNGVVIFTRIRYAYDPSDKDYQKLSTFKEIYGLADTKVSTGSNFYGRYATTYIYPDKGIAAIVNEEAGMVYEVHHFKPMSVESYINTYGNDIHRGAWQEESHP